MQDRLRLVTGVAPVLATAISFGVAVQGSGIELGAFLGITLRSVFHAGDRGVERSAAGLVACANP